MLRSMLQMTSMMRDAGLAPPDMFGGAPGGGFPAPGNPNAAGTPSGAGAGSVPGAAASPFGVPPNPFGGGDPAALLRMLGGAGAPGAAGAGGFNPFFGGAPAAPADTRSPEERFQVQLQVCSPIVFLRPASLNMSRLDVATPRYGLFKCESECACTLGHWRERALRNRVYSWRRRVVNRNQCNQWVDRRGFDIL